MKEAQRFLRYVIPGLTLIIELLVYLLISGNICFSQLIEQVNTMEIVVSAFLASGGLGFLFGVIYYTLVWREKILIKILSGADLRSVLSIAESSGWLKLYSTKEKEVKSNSLKKRDAWRVVISYWNIRVGTSDSIKGALPRLDRLADIMNGLGTTCLASFGALLFFSIYNIFNANILNAFPGEISFWGCFSFMVGSIILFIHHLNYTGVIKDYEKVVSAILLNEFELENMQGKVVKIYV